MRTTTSASPTPHLRRLAPLLLLALPLAARAAGACPEGMRPIGGGRFRLADGSSAANLAPFCMDRVEVTVASYAACVRSGRCKDEGLACGKAATYGAKGKGDHPVNCVTWIDADRFCRAIGKRLPTEAEWEWAARGQTRGTVYPWGAAAPADRACWDGKGSELGAGERNETCPVGSHPSGDSPDGLSDLGGNVREWTDSADGRMKVVRGGSWGDSLPDFLAAGFRGMNAPDERFELTGFRCAAEPGAAVVPLQVASAVPAPASAPKAEPPAAPAPVAAPAPAPAARSATRPVRPAAPKVQLQIGDIQFQQSDRAAAGAGR
ncbi:MAG TPA: SUMF1/EgtB/PvdO family nonheme iron enzyme [Anaeromyxobacteraceae bacterium]|nr:SUMF1/EgtB/PvdO family nonheme iron enzyme [Anaeromyxobacteraceae bacterium]